MCNPCAARYATGSVQIPSPDPMMTDANRVAMSSVLTSELFIILSVVNQLASLNVGVEVCPKTKNRINNV